ncbi:MAG: hypothetical protein FWC57_03485 [Endomicrobia bacterium]|nr:hypothetical protein [Endomicrobiia bacterium]
MKKTFLFLTFVLLSCAGYSYAQTIDDAMKKIDAAEAAAQTSTAPASAASKWKTSGIFVWNYSQSAISDNWAGAETYSRSWQAKLDLSAERISPNTNWFTTFKEYYGETEARNSHSVSLDMIEFNTVWMYRVYRYLQPYASFYVLSQNNKFWDPVTYMESAGLNFTIFQNAINTLRIRTGAALRQVDDSVNGNKRESGAEAIMDYNLTFNKAAKFMSQARFFESFGFGEDLRWDNRLFLKTGPWFTTELGYTLFFDRSRVPPLPRLPAHSWPHDIESMFYIGLGFSFNIFQR